jgi:O-antigen ligase
MTRTREGQVWKARPTLGLTQSADFRITPAVSREGGPILPTILPIRTVGPGAWLAAGTPLERATQLLAVVTAFSIPLSTSFSEIATGLFMACWLASGKFTAKWTIIRRNNAALLSLALFGLLLLGMSWSTESLSVSGRCLLKYRELVYLPMFVVVFQEARLRRLATSAYMAAAVALLVLSYFEWGTGFNLGIGTHPLDMSPVISKDRIIHSLMMALLVYLAAVRFADTGGDPATAEPSSPWRWAYAVIAGLAVFNTLFMVEGRTGYLLLGALTMLALFERLGRRGVVIACVLFAVVAGAGYSASSVVRRRVTQTITQLQNQFGPERKHSVDPRLEFYENTLKLVCRHPFLGTGTGSFQGEYARLIADTDDRPTSDPHNEYLHLACQVGVGGPLLFLALLGVQWISVRRLDVPESHIGRAVVLIIALGSVFNSLILSVTGGLIYAFFSGLAFADLSQWKQVESLSVTQDCKADATHPAKRRAA